MHALSAEFGDEGVVFTTDVPSGVADFSTIYIAPDATDFLGDDSIVAIAEHVDVGNRDLSDQAFVASDAVFEELEQANLGVYSDALAAIIAHEVGHLRGLVHDHTGETDESVLDAVAAHRLPTTPSLTSAKAVSSTDVELDWGSTKYEDGYRVQRWTGSGWREIGRTRMNDTDYRVRGLNPGTTYYFRIEAYNTTGSRFSNWRSVRTRSVELQAPTLHTATAISATEVRLSWSNVQNENGYKIQRWNGREWQQIAREGRDDTSYTVRGLNPNTTYYFKVSTYNASAEKSSSWKSVRTESVELKAPTLHAATAVSGSEVRLSWSNVRNEEGYKIYKWNGSGWQQIAREGRNDTSYTVRGLKPDTSYWFKVAAYRGAAEKHPEWKYVRTQSWTPAIPGAEDTVSSDGWNIARVIDGFNVESNSRYLKRNGNTYCNLFVGDVTARLGVPIPNQPHTTPNGRWYRANDQYRWLLNEGRDHHWYEVSGRVAQQYANRGYVAVAAWYNPKGHPGHIAMVRPHAWNGSYSDHYGPRIAQAGRHNYNSTTVRTGFEGASGVRYFVHNRD